MRGYCCFKPMLETINTFVKQKGITWLFNSEFYPYPSAIKAIREAAEICGFEKLMWGSDYPRTMVEITYKMSFDFVLKSNDISDSVKKNSCIKMQKIFTALRILKKSSLFKICWSKKGGHR